MVTSKKIYEYSNFVCVNELIFDRGPVEVVKPLENNLIVAFRDGTLQMWDISGEKLVQEFIGHEDLISCLVIHEEFGLIVTGSRDKTIKIWDYTGNCIQTLKGHTGGILGVDIDINNNLIFSASEDSSIKIWNMEGVLKQTITGHKRKVSKIKVLEDNNQILAVSWDHHISFWDYEGNCLKMLRGHYDAIDALDANNMYAVTGDHTGIVCIWDIKNRKLLYNFRAHDSLITSVKIGQNNFYTSSKDLTVKQWDMEGNCLKKIESHIDAVLDVGKTDNLLYTSGADGKIAIWDDNTKNSTNKKDLSGKILDIDYNEDKQQIVTTGTDNILRIWDLKGKLIKKINTNYDSWIWGTSYFENKIITSSDEGTYRMYDAESGEMLKKFVGHKSATYRVSVNKEKNVMVTNSWDNTSRIWDLETGECLTVLKGHTYAVYSSYLTSTKIVTGSSDGTVRVWNYQGECLKVLRGHKGEIFHIAGEGNIVVTACSDKTIKIYDIDKYECLGTLEGHKDQVWTIGLKNGIIISGSLSQTIKIWDLKTQTCLKTLEGHIDGVKDIAIGNEKLFSCDYSGRLLFWDISEYIEEQFKKETRKITKQQETILALMQVGRAYNLLPTVFGDPDISRLIYGYKPFKELESDDNDIYEFKIFKEKVNSWRVLGHVGYTPWVNDISNLIEENKLILGEEETLDTILNDFIIGVRESEYLYWFGLLREMGSSPKALIPKEWTFELEFSGKGPNPVDLDYEWTKLGSKFNKVKLKDRRETALVFKLSLKNLAVWLLPLIKSVTVEIKSDRGDVETIIFNDFVTDEFGTWYDIAMFKIDSGYSLEPNAQIIIADIRVQYEEDLIPNLETSMLLEQVELIQKEQYKLQTQIQLLNNEIINKKEEIPKITDQSNINDLEIDIEEVEPTKRQSYEIKNLKNSVEAKELFEVLQSSFKRPRIGSLEISIGGKISSIDKFLEYIQPKFIMMTFGTSIVSFVMVLLTYAMIYGDINLLGAPISIADYDLAITTTEISVYALVYGVLVLILVVSVLSWVRYQTKRQKIKNK